MSVILSARRTVEPTVEPVTKAEVKANSRIDTNAEDSLLDLLIAAARSECENRAWLSLCTQTWRVYLPDWPSEPLILPRHPVQSISSVTYFDSSDASHTLSSSIYALVPSSGQDASIALAANQEWPSVTLSDRQYPIEIEYVTGFGDAAAVPNLIKAWLLRFVGNLYEYRESVQVIPGVSAAIEMGFIDNLLDDYRGFRY